MGPTNVALVKYFEADRQLRLAQARLDAAAKDVRVQERRVNDQAEKQKLAQQQLRDAQSKAAGLELDLKSRDEHIEKLRTQQQTARNNKEYQTFLLEISTSRVDRNKIEDETMKVLEEVERGTSELTTLTTQLDSEREKLSTMREAVSGKLAEIQSEIDALRPSVEEAGAAVPARARDVFDRLADRFEGEALSALSKPDRRREEYVCSACNMELVADIYNKLHSRDELVFCPSCKRILYIPDDLPPEVAIKGKPAAKKVSEDGAEPKPRRAAAKRSPRSVPDADPQQRALLKAAGESAQNAIAAGSEPGEFEILIDGKSVGTFKGQSVENLQRTARFCLGEAGLSGEVTVIDRHDGDAAHSGAGASDSSTAI